MANGNGVGEKFSPQNLWVLLLVAALGGLGGGVGWRQIDPTAFTSQQWKEEVVDLDRRDEKMSERIRFLEIQQSNISGIEYRLDRIEEHLDKLIKWDTQHYQQEHRNRAQSGGK